jgi:hypothetical protein
MNTAICLLLAIPVRKEPSHRSEMVSQLLFGEYAELHEEDGDFVKVKCLYDSYEGWVQANQLTAVTPQQVFSTNEYISLNVDEVLVNGWCRNLPFGTAFYPATNQWGEIEFGNHHVGYHLSAIWNSLEKTIDDESLTQIAHIYLRTPYLWGGKSVYGIDCSGFVQQTFKMFGIKLLRDAWQQATQGEEVKSIDETKSGDLAFFQNEKGRITHVGIIWKGNKILHASGMVRSDTLDKDGIMNLERGKRTHHLHSIRRYF